MLVEPPSNNTHIQWVLPNGADGPAFGPHCVTHLHYPPRALPPHFYAGRLVGIIPTPHIALGVVLTLYFPSPDIVCHIYVCPVIW